MKTVSTHFMPKERKCLLISPLPNKKFERLCRLEFKNWLKKIKAKTQMIKHTCIYTFPFIYRFEHIKVSKKKKNV